ncbi:unnamed protein product [Calypogeia fissa]
MGAPAENASVTSSGLFAHDDPLKHSLLLLIAQIVIILSFSRLISFVFRPLRQPRVVAELISGILLGPTAFGSIHQFSDAIFPKSSLNVLQTVANFGLIFFLFLVGLELDFGVLKKTGSQAMAIATVGIVLPFALGIPVSLQIFKEAGMQHTGEHFGLPFILFVGVALSITAFPVLARILAERKIMNTEVGQIAISAAAVNDVAAWVLLGLAVAVSNSGSSPLVILWVLLAAFVYLGIMFIIVRPFVRHILAKQDPVPEYAIAITFLLLLLSSLATDAIGVNVIFGAFIMGLIIPKDRSISVVLIEKVEDYVSILLLPLYFASSGLNVELNSISNGKVVGAFLLVTATAIAGKVVGTMVVAKLYGLGVRKSAALGFLMSTKGLVELIVLNIGLSRGVINKEIFAIMVLMALVTTIATTPMIMWLYKPARDLPAYKRRNLEALKWSDDDKLRMLVCLYSMRNVPSMMSLVEMSKGRHGSRKLFQVNALHLLEFSDRLAGVKMAEVLKASDCGNDETDPQDATPLKEDALATSMRTFGQVNNINIKVTASMSRMSTMHEDVCLAAVKSRANIVILPYHKYSRPDGTLQSGGTAFLQVNQKVLKESPCSVAILVDRGLGSSTPSSASASVQQQQSYPHNHILVLFFGGPDDREALWLAKRMADHNSVKLTIVQCILEDWSHDQPATLERSSQMRMSSKEKCPIPISHHSNLDWLMRWGRRSLHWFTNRHAQEASAYSESVTSLQQVNESTDMSTQNYSSGPTPSSNGNTSSTPTDGTTTLMDSFYQSNGSLEDDDIQVPAGQLDSFYQSNGSHEDDDIQVPAGQLEEENEKNEDEKILDHFRRAAADIDMKDRITVKTLEMDAIEEFLGAGAGGEDYGLILVGLHSSRVDVFQNTLWSSTQSVIIDHALGAVGNWLITKESLLARSSLLVIWQHECFRSQSMGRKLRSIVDDEVENSVVHFQEESSQPARPEN